MRRSKLVRGCLTVLLTLPLTALAQQNQDQGRINQSQDDVLLEQRVLSEALKTQNATQAPVQTTFNYDLLIAPPRTKTPRCQDVQKNIIAKKYLYTTDENGNPCRIYDLSFPNLKAFFTSKKVMKVPVQKLMARDYLNWLDGNFTAIAKNNELFRLNFNAKTVAHQSWVSRLKFRNQPNAVPGSQINVADIGLPKSFRISDLAIGNRFQFDAKTKYELETVLNEIAKNDPLAAEGFLQVLNKPESILSKIRFDWNDLEKVYDVILEGEFLPFKPVALIEYQAQYKYAVEKMFRSMLASALTSLAGMIPTPMIASAVTVLIEDAFEQVNFAYEYQMLQLEDTLRTVEPALSNRAMAVLYGERSDLFQSYMLAVAQGKTFDWEALEKLGRTTRYATEKQRDVTMSKMNSKLVLQKKCQTEFMNDYFAVCTKNGNREAVYSLISDQKIFSKDLGAPVIYKYDRPYETTLRRGLTWALSIGLRVVGLPVAPSAVRQLDAELKGYMHSGMLDDALLRNHVVAKDPSGEMTKWLYIQNLNVFLPKSLASENKVIDANKALLEINN